MVVYLTDEGRLRFIPPVIRLALLDPGNWEVGEYEIRYTGPTFFPDDELDAPEPGEPKVVGYLTDHFLTTKHRTKAGTIHAHRLGASDVYRNPVVLQSDHEAVVRGLTMDVADRTVNAMESEVAKVSDKLQEVSQEADRLQAENERLYEDFGATSKRLVQRQARIQILAEGGEPEGDTDFPAAHDVRALRRKYEEAKDEITRLKAENERLRGCNGEHKEDVRRLRESNETLRAERDAYADPANWEIGPKDDNDEWDRPLRFTSYAPRYIGPTPSDTEARIYPCNNCDTMRTKAEGGTVFTVCEECWAKKYGPSDSTEAESVEGRAWVRHNDMNLVPVPEHWPLGTPVKITRIPTPGGDDGADL